MTLAAFAAALREVTSRLAKVTSAAKGKALVPEYTALADQVVTVIPPILERRTPNRERRIADGTQSRPRMRVRTRRGGVRVAVDPPALIATTLVITSVAPVNFAAPSTYQLTWELFDRLDLSVTGRAAAFVSGTPSVATVHASTGLVTAVSSGSATITATSEGISDSQSIVIVSSPQNSVSTVTVAPTALALSTNTSSTMTATARDASSNILTGKTFTWGSSDSGKATVTSPANPTTVTAVAAGTSNVTATCDAVNAAAVIVTVTAPPAATGNPTPSGTIYLDTRSGGANSLQAVTTLAQAFTAWSVGTPTPYFSSNIGFTTNMDGAGTRALSSVMSSWGGTSYDGGSQMAWYIPSPYPTEFYIQWKHRMGRTATGGGIGTIGFFDVTNGSDPGGNAGRKYLLMLRDVPDRGSGGRIDHVWAGPTPPSVHTEGWYGLVPYPGNMALNVTGFNPEDHYNETITFTHYIKAASALGASDGIVRVWYNGVLCSEHTGVPIGHLGIHRFQFPATFRSPIADMTEYWWDIVVWKP